MTPGGLPRGDLLGRFRSYEDAQKVVDRLAQADSFDVKSISIVGNDLRSVESVRSRLSYPRVAGAGAAQGAMFGFFIGLLIWLFAPESPVLNLALAVLLGMAIWMIIGVISYAIRRGQRDFASSSQLVATTYDVVCDAGSAGRARHILGPMPQQGQVTGVGAAPTQAAAATPTPVSAAAPTQAPAEGPAHAAEGSRLPDDDAPAGAPVEQQPGEQPHQPSAEHAADNEQSPTGTVEEETAEEASASQTSPGARGGYRDLPDGRPRYGVRREDVQD